MKPLLFPALVVGLLFAADDAKNDAVKEELRRLEGNYTIASAEANGTQVQQQVLEQFKLKIDGAKWSVSTNQGKIEATIEIDPTKTPKTIDFTYIEGQQKGQSTRGIYSLERDELKLCRTAAA